MSVVTSDGVTIGVRPTKKKPSSGSLTGTGDVHIVLTGKTPLVCHNIQLADPDQPVVRQIATLTGKQARSKTEEDRLKIAQLEWYGGLYVVPGIDGPAMPTANIRKCLMEAAKVTRQGTQIARALVFKDNHVRIEFPGTHDLDALFADPNHHLRLSVGVNGKRSMRTRPQFPVWRVEADALLIPDVMNLDDLKRIADLAAQIEGLGDARRIGFGRFEVEVIGD